ncbi:hypothetical protein [Oleidesulfovibrio sp.]
MTQKETLAPERHSSTQPRRFDDNLTHQSWDKAFLPYATSLDR